MKNLLIIMLLIFSCSLVFAQERNVIWVHGLNGSGDFWNQEYARIDRDYRVNSSGSTFRSDDGVEQYSNRLRSFANTYRGSQTIAIGHSMGGVAIREVDRDDSGVFGGAITFGAPLDGARIANEVIIGTNINNFIISSVDNIQRGPIAAAARTRWQVFRDNVSQVINGQGQSALIRTFASGAILDVTDDLVDGFNESIVNNFDPNQQSVRDLAEGSSYFNTIRNYTNSKPRIFAYGDEQDPTHIRMLISEITLDNTFSGLLLDTYNAIRTGYKSTADGIDPGWWIFCGSTCRREKREKEAWYVGYDYLTSGWQIAWNNLTDARFRETYTEFIPVWECDNTPPPGGGGGNPNPPGPSPLPLPQLVSFEPIDPCPILQTVIVDNNSSSNCPGGNCRWVNKPVTRTRWVTQPNDGLLKKSTQIGEISKWEGVHRRLRNVNHLEMGVHPETTTLLNRALNGSEDNFFRTNAR